MYKSRIGNRRLVSKDFIVLLVISCVIASSVAFYFLQSWLQQYCYRINIGMGLFIQPALMGAEITVITKIFLALKAAMANQVESLRKE